MDVGGLVSGLVSSSVYLMTRPFFFCIYACVFCLKTALVTTFVSTDMVTSAIWFNLSMLWRAVWGSVWGFILLFTFPIRFLASIPRERLLEQSIYDLRHELEILEWNRKQVEENLREAIKEYRIMEHNLDELEDEHDEAITKIEKLEAELKELKEENLQLRDVIWSKKGKVKPNEERSEIRSILKTKNIAYGSKEKAKSTSVKSPLYPFVKSTIPKDEELTPRVIGLERQIAVSRSVFSAMLALLVGIVMYGAKEQELCTPLIGALFTVVGISLRSVVQFFSTVKDKPAIDAVALMSLNWFIIGTLTYPTLPRIASMVVPRIFSTAGSVFSLLGGGPVFSLLGGGSVPSPPELVNYVG